MKKNLNFAVLTITIGLLLIFNTILYFKNGNEEKVISSNVSRDTVSIDYIFMAKKIIDRAKEITVYIPDSNSREKIFFGLSQMKIFLADEKGEVSFDNRQQFILIVRKSVHFKKSMNVNARTFMQFDNDLFQATNHIIISINDSMFHFSQNLDGQACLLIHEYIHALQANNRKKMGINEKGSVFTDEQQAWESSVYLYEKLNPQILGITVDCNNFTIYVNSEKQKKDIKDPITMSFILHRYCKDIYLKTICVDDR
jgi:hypothetical protein